VNKDLSFEVDIFDKGSIKKRLPELAALIEVKRSELGELEQRYEQLRIWAGLSQRDRKQARAEVQRQKKTTIEDEAVRVVTEAKRPMAIMEVFVEVDRKTTPKTVNWALWSAAKKGRLFHVADGLYAPPGYEMQKELVSTNGSEADKTEAEASPVTRGNAS
jgi:hypothetical protein